MEEDDIAAAMGFSSFGGTKRKHDQTQSPKSKPGGSGANSTELGVRSKNAAQETEDNGGPPATEENKDMIKGKQKKKNPASSGLADFLARGHTLPEKPPTAVPKPNNTPIQDHGSEMTSFGGPEISRAALNDLRRGVANEEGDIAYFLPSFVEDPWEKFGKAKQW